MRKFTLLLTGIVLMNILPVKTVAQWYKSYGAASVYELTEPQLMAAWEKTKKISGAGWAIGTIGALTAVAGGMYYTVNSIRMETAHYYNIDLYSDRALLGSYIMGGGMGLVGVALPFIIVGYSRRADIGIAISKYPAKIALKPYFTGEFKCFSSGLTVAFRFE
jgi:hypothetical protein